MPLTLTFIIPNIRNIKTRAFTDPAQYDTEINSARGFKSPIVSKTKSKSKSKSKVRVENGITYDPAQFDADENVKRHYKGKSD